MASDASAILSYTKQVIYLNDGEIAVINRDKISFTDLNYEKISKKSEILEGDFEKKPKGKISALYA